LEVGMALTGIEHYLVLTDDIEATREFYCTTLGLHVGSRPSAATFPGYWLYAGNTPCVHVTQRVAFTAYSSNLGLSVSPEADGTGALDHIGFDAENYDEVLARIERSGVPVSRNDVPTMGLRQLTLKDPNGIRIEINIRNKHQS
jgi:catechol 2,3-dioxygenase-like lactoylglutathione lyase family enzyme